ncbi:MAG: 16S rRNA (guanine(527)-N(7))-methyltransferase RsmG [Bacillales bacterium]|nr:16S rRNA (guanine(527)-N(7))-methyltransferase RsmG [Bacillales bacterium]
MTQNDFITKVNELGLEVTDEKLDKLNKYYELLVSFNEKINLTAITLKEEVYLKHFYDSLTLVKIIDFNKYNTFCDIGTGAGFPGIVIKIFFPHLKVTLIDALNKRIDFLNVVISELQLKEIETIHSRIEDYGKNNRELYDIVTARAVTNLSNLLEFAIPIVKVNKYFIAMKGSNNELDTILNASKLLNIKLEDKIEFSLPYEESKRNLIKFVKLDKTNNKYPRKFSEIKKKPL